MSKKNLSALIKRRRRSRKRSCTISNVTPKSREIVIGWHFGHEFGGNGYATEAAAELLRIGFELHNVSEIHADCFAGNRASIRIMEKIGMTSRPYLELFNVIRGWSYGEHKPSVRYVISRWDWMETVKTL